MESNKKTSKASFKLLTKQPVPVAATPIAPLSDTLMAIIQVLLKSKEERKDKDFIYIQKILKDISFFKQRDMNH